MTAISGAPAEGWDADEEGVRIPDGVTPIVAYRMWLVDHHGAIMSANRTLRWAGRNWVTARCGWPRYDPEADPPGHWAPAEGCRCGIYAFKSPADAARMLTRFAYGRYRVLPKEPTFASGVVELAGVVIEHEFGYRAERARIVTIIPLQWRPFPLESDVTIGARHPTAPSTYQLAADVGRRALRLRLRGRRPREGDPELLARLLFRP